MKHKLIPILLVSLFFLASCGTFNRGGGVTGTTVHEGVAGLEMEWLDPTLIAVSEEDEFTIDVTFSNEGAADIQNGIIYLGLEEKRMETSFDYDQTLNLEGKKRTVPVGQQETRSFAIKTKKLDNQTERAAANLFVAACYGYHTEAIFNNICIRPKKDEIATEDACELTAISSPGQGAPVAVTRVEPKILGVKELRPQFTLFIENRGEGEVVRYNPETGESKIDEACSAAKLDANDINIVYINAFLSELPLECKPNPVKLKGRGTSVRCTLEEAIVEDEPAFTTLLTVFLDYGYLQSIPREVVIEKGFD